jgi:SH3 domain protein
MRIIQKTTHSFICPEYSLRLYRIIFLLILLAAPVTISAADTYLITSDSEVPVRSGQGTEYRTVAILKNGDPVSSLEEAGYWVKIRTATSKEGWILKRYLSTTSSKDEPLSLPTENNQANKPLKVTPTLPDPLQHSLQPVTNEATPEKLQNPLSAPPLPHLDPTQKDHEKELTELRNKLAALTDENQELQDHEKILWFLTGAGVFIVGWLLGLISGKARKRKPSLL